MSFSFTETVTVPIPNIEVDISNFSESAYKADHGLIVEIAAIHEGVTQNFTEYKASELANALHTWYTPYQKPVIMNHDKESEPIGRVVGAKMAQEDDGTPYALLQAAIVDPLAVQKIMDRRYITGSIGGKTNEAVCSICNTDWAKPKEGLRGMPCPHQRGKAYKGKVATLQMGDITFVEYSFVNVPADSLSGVRSIKTTEESDSWNHAAKFFVLDLGRESIVECKEGVEGGVDILGEMRKKEATPLYHEIKGAFIQAQISNNIDNEESANAYIGDTTNIDNGSVEPSSEENNGMANEDHVDTTEQEEDILAVIDGLNEDFDAAATADESASDETEESLEQDEAEEAAEDTNESDDQSETEEAEQAQDTAEAENSDDASDAQESDETEEVEEQTLEAEESDETEQADETDLTESTSVEVDESTVEELKSRIATLEEANAKLKKALHRGLAERVVDTKISVGLIEAADRSAAIAEHADRTAASLADSLRDMASLAPQTKTAGSVAPQESVAPTALAVEGEDSEVIIGESTSQEEAANPAQVLEDVVFEALMGRRAL